MRTFADVLHAFIGEVNERGVFHQHTNRTLSLFSAANDKRNINGYNFSSVGKIVEANDDLVDVRSEQCVGDVRSKRSFSVDDILRNIFEVSGDASQIVGNDLHDFACHVERARCMMKVISHVEIYDKRHFISAFHERFLPRQII